MAIRIGINGFGRIGRLVFRSAINNDDFNIISINDLLDINHLAYLLKYDSVHGRFPGDIKIIGNNIDVGRGTIDMQATYNPAELNWEGIDVLLECTGVHNSKEASMIHLENGAKRVLLLPVGGAFHSPFMEPARLELAAAIETAKIDRPICPIFQNVNAKASQNEVEIKANLIAQLTGPVRWTQSIEAMISAGATDFIECGPGKVLQGLVRKINAEAMVSSMELIS